jgi:hypothetical protein
MNAFLFKILTIIGHGFFIAKAFVQPLGRVNRYNSDVHLSSYDGKILVNTVFGTGRPTTTDTTGLDGEINAPIDSIYDPSETYLYLTDQNGGGLIRKLAVTSQFTSPYTALFFVKTVFVGNDTF